MTTITFNDTNRLLDDFKEAITNSTIVTGIDENKKIMTDELDKNVISLINKLKVYNKLLDMYKTFQTNYVNDRTNINQAVIHDYKNKSITNDRKSFYEAQEYDNLINWYSIFWWIYYVLAIVASAIIFLSISPETISFTFKCLISVFIFAYPFVISYIVFPFVALYKFLYQFFPTNVYKSL